MGDERRRGVDVRIEGEMVELFKKIERKRGVCIIVMREDLGVVGQTGERVGVT
ncbi:hypothetical protein [Bacillus velezensis]|uniref:hypothetical protein n=1 Tax=Bacillus velezensis TaxID=492670 RepID=UPI0016439108|nr:hypothetical protein [Bacillus velezensis]